MPSFFWNTVAAFGLVAVLTPAIGPAWADTISGPSYLDPDAEQGSLFVDPSTGQRAGTPPPREKLPPAPALDSETQTDVDSQSAAALNGTVTSTSLTTKDGKVEGAIDDDNPGVAKIVGVLDKTPGTPGKDGRPPNNGQPRNTTPPPEPELDPDPVLFIFGDVAVFIPPEDPDDPNPPASCMFVATDWGQFGIAAFIPGVGSQTVRVCPSGPIEGDPGNVPQPAITDVREIPLPTPVVRVSGKFGGVTGMRHGVITGDAPFTETIEDTAGGDVTVTFSPQRWVTSTTPATDSAVTVYEQQGTIGGVQGPTQPIVFTAKGCHRAIHTVVWRADITWTENLGPDDDGPAQVETGYIMLATGTAFLQNVFSLVPVNVHVDANGNRLYNPNDPANRSKPDLDPGPIYIPDHCHNVTLEDF